MTVVVYTKPSSVQCTATLKALDAKKIEYEVRDCAVDDAAITHVMELGYRQGPVVISEWGHWSGFRQDKINQLAEVLQLQRALSEAISKLQGSMVKQ